MSHRLFQAPNLHVHLVPGGYIVHHRESGQVHQLNATATLLFELSNGTAAADAVVELARTALGVTAKESGALREGLQQLLAKGLVVAKPGPPPAAARKAALKKTVKPTAVKKKAVKKKLSPRRR